MRKKFQCVLASMLTAAVVWAAPTFAQNEENESNVSLSDLISDRNVTIYGTEEESLRYSALVMAGETGISQQKAYEMLKFQNDFSAIMQKELLPTNRVAAYEVLPAPEIGAIVRLTAGPRHSAEKALASFPNVQIKRDARYSLYDQFFRVEATTAGLRSLGIDKYRVSPGPDQISVQLPEGHRVSADKISAAIEVAAANMGGPSVWPGIGSMEAPGINARSSARNFKPVDLNIEELPLERFDISLEVGAEIGGSQLYNYNKGGLRSECTSSFTTYRGVLTAGHCLDDDGFDQPSWSVSHYFCCLPNRLYPVQSYQGVLGDAGVLRNNYGYYPYFWNSTGGLSYQGGAAYASTNQYLCNFGRNKGYTSCYHQFVRWINLSGTNVPKWFMELSNSNTDGGDSGGPYFSGSIGYGVHSASDGYYGGSLYMTALPYALYALGTNIRR